MYLIYILYKVRMLVSLSCAYNMKSQTWNRKLCIRDKVWTYLKWSCRRLAVSTSPSLFSCSGCLTPARACSLCSIVGDEDREVQLPASSLDGLALKSSGRSVAPEGTGVGVLQVTDTDGDLLGVGVDDCFGLPRDSFLLSDWALLRFWALLRCWDCCRSCCCCSCCSCWW